VTSPESFLEVEYKFRVPAGFALPDFEHLGFRTDEQEPLDLTAAYFDTDSATLLRWGVTLRHRTGGVDDGWHTKIPLESDEGIMREEIRMPGESADVPAELIEILSPLLRGQPVSHRATVRTRRHPFVISATSPHMPSADGEALVEVVLDDVSVHTGHGTTDNFHEIEVELVSESKRAQEAALTICTILESLGAEPHSLSKAASALGAQVTAPADVPVFAPAGPDDLAVDALKGLLAQHVRHLILADVGVRRGGDDAVHQMRVAARRLRSVLSTYHALLDTEESEGLRSELSWLASELGGVRDTEVLFDHLSELAQDLDADTDAAAAQEVLDHWYEQRMRTAEASALAALRSDRHQYLLEDLIKAIHEPPVNDRAFEPVAKVLLPEVAKVWSRLQRQVKKLHEWSADEDWHRVRISAKKARYAAESLAPAMGKPMRKLAERLAEITDLLGAHQDAHMARERLREFAAFPDLSAAHGFVLGVMYEQELEMQHDFRLEFAHLWEKARRAAVRAKVA
jgi:CHAD domain-containing protein